eukprot:6184418-Heterocapsa_arctica.AAC.1
MLGILLHAIIGPVISTPSIVRTSLWVPCGVAHRWFNVLMMSCGKSSMQTGMMLVPPLQAEMRMVTCLVWG